MAVYEMTMGGCGPCICKKCLLWWSGRCPRGGCWDEWRAEHEPWPGPVRKQWSDWDKPGEQAHWCRGGACYAAMACPDYIEYEADKAIVQDCLNGAVVKYQDGYIQCSMIDVMGCEECYRRFEERIEREEERVIKNNRTNELQGQYEMDDLLPRNEGQREQEWPEGYDADGNLLNVDYQSPPSPTEPSPSWGRWTAKRAWRGPQRHDHRPIITDVTNDTPQTSADADRLSALATEIKAITEQTRGVVISAALAVGKRLIEARALCQEGCWLEWLRNSVSYSERKAQDMMRLYEEYGRNGSIPDSIAALDYSKAVALLSAPADQREALAERAADDDLSVRQLQAEIKRLKEEAAKAQQTIFDQDYKLKRAAREMEDLNDAHADTVANLNAARDAVQRKEEDFYAALDQKDAELKETKRVLADAAEKVTVAQAKTAAAEAAAEQLKRLRAEAEERADQNAQRYGDALKRANETAKQLAEAKARIQALSEAAAAGAPEPEVRTVEVIPEETRREIEQLRRELAEARALQKPSPGGEGGPRSGSDEVPSASATEKFKWFYANQMQPTFKQALALLKEVAQEDGHAADAFATAVTKGCQVLMNQLGS